MNRENMIRWIEALESGKYEQTQAKLVDWDPDEDRPGGYCCLGVLCQIAGVPMDEGHHGFLFAVGDDDGVYDSYPPLAPFEDFLGFDAFDPRLKVVEEDTRDHFTLTVAATDDERIMYGLERIAVDNLNDRHSSFVEIAARLRAEYLADA